MLVILLQIMLALVLSVGSGVDHVNSPLIPEGEFFVEVEAEDGSKVMKEVAEVSKDVAVESKVVYKTEVGKEIVVQEEAKEVAEEEVIVQEDVAEEEVIVQEDVAEVVEEDLEPIEEENVYYPVSSEMVDLFHATGYREVEKFRFMVDKYNFERLFETEEDTAKDFMNALLSDGYGGVYEVSGEPEDGLQEVVHIYNGNSYWIDERSNLEQGDKVLVLNHEDDLFFQGKINF